MVRKSDKKLKALKGIVFFPERRELHPPVFRSQVDLRSALSLHGKEGLRFPSFVFFQLKL